MKLTVKSVPPSVNNLTIIPHSVYALVTWELHGNGGYPITNFLLQYRKIKTKNDSGVASHSELKFQKKSIFKSTKSTFLTFSKVQKHIFCYFKNGKKSIFAQKKSLKLWKMQFLDWNYTFFHVSGHSAASTSSWQSHEFYGQVRSLEAHGLRLATMSLSGTNGVQS